MILTGDQIREEIANGYISITPFREECIQPNNYDFHLGSEMLVVSHDFLSNNELSKCSPIAFDKSGIILEPNKLYLGITEEETATSRYAQLLFGDRSIGSLGIWVQISAPLAHVGSYIRWTLEIRVIKRITVYPGMKFGKICFLKNHGLKIPYGNEHFWNSGRYLNNEITPSLLSLDSQVVEKCEF